VACAHSNFKFSGPPAFVPPDKKPLFRKQTLAGFLSDHQIWQQNSRNLLLVIQLSSPKKISQSSILSRCWASGLQFLSKCLYFQRRNDMATKKRDDQRKDDNRDPLSNEPGAHPVGTGLGAAAGGAAGGVALGAAGAAIEGAIAGTVVGGPVGTAVGAAAGVIAGAIGGGLAGKSIAESIDPTVEEAHWRQQYQSRPYYEKGSTFDDYGPAYRYGWESRGRYGDSSYEDVESDLESGWEKAKGKSRLAWERARHATRDAWDRLAGDASRRDRPLPRKG
jgi:hypothetical protein